MNECMIDRLDRAEAADLVHLLDISIDTLARLRRSLYRSFCKAPVEACFIIQRLVELNVGRANYTDNCALLGLNKEPSRGS